MKDVGGGGEEIAVELMFHSKYSSGRLIDLLSRLINLLISGIIII
jgi:hypothetical protein